MSWQKTRGWPLVGLVLFAVSCGEADDESEPGASAGASSDGGSAEGAGGSANRLLDACIRTCEKQASTKCSGAADRSECKSLCNTVQADTKCGTTYLAFAECGSTKASYACTPSGQLEMTGCWTELQPYAECTACRSPGTDACDSCSATNCCDERERYWGHEDLVPFFECERSCVVRDAGSDCNCATRYSSVVRAVNAMLQCHAERCDPECP